MDLFDLLPAWLLALAAIAGVALLATLRYRHCERRGRRRWAAIVVPTVPSAPYRTTSFSALERAPLAVRLQTFAVIAVGAVWPLALLDALDGAPGARWAFDAVVVLGCSRLWARGSTALLAPQGRPLTLVATGTLVIAFLFSLARSISPAHAQCVTTQASAKALRDVTLVFRAEHPDEPCPTAKALLAMGYIDAASKLTDAWDAPFFIDCPGDDVRVSSAGRDHMLGSSDDIVVPIEARRRGER